MKHSSSEDDNGETVGDFDQYSTSIVWKGVYDVASSDLLPELNAAPSCEFTYNFGILPDEIDILPAAICGWFILELYVVSVGLYFTFKQI